MQKQEKERKEMMWQIIKKALAILYEVSSYDKKGGKPLWRSKTLWANAITISALISSKYAGVEINTEEQLAILSIINIIIRLITKGETGLIERRRGK